MVDEIEKFEFESRHRFLRIASAAAGATIVLGSDQIVGALAQDAGAKRSDAVAAGTPRDSIRDSNTV